jgi:hypothetical protein
MCSMRGHATLRIRILSLFVGVALVGAHEPGAVPQWIWPSPWTGPHRHATLRRDFKLTRAIARAELSALADDRATIHLDGAPVAEVAGHRTWTRIKLPGLAAGIHRLAIHAENRGGSAGVCLRLRLFDEAGVPFDLVTDPRWQGHESTEGPSNTDWLMAPIPADLTPAHSFGLVGVPPWHEPTGDAGDYHQWKRALGSTAAEIRAMPGFKVEMVRAARPGESSWVSMAFLANGDLLLGCEGRDRRHGMIRLHSDNGAFTSNSRTSSAEATLHEPRGITVLDSAIHVNANNDKALFRLRLEGDGFGKPERLVETPGDVGHGRNQLLRQGKLLYSIHGNDVRLPTGFALERSRFRGIANDVMDPCHWDRFLFDVAARLPAGHLARSTEDGGDWDLVAVGMRNPFGVDASPDGDLFTFDADNEGDLGTPWYRPNRVLAMVPGADFGWRQGTAMRPGWHPESHPAVLDIGKASPTAVRFGRGFSKPYRDALFILDWAYGRVYAIHLIPRGAGYVAQAELVFDGRPLNVVDLAFGPDGAMYFVTGGRGTQSCLYRASFTDPRSPLVEEPVSPTEAAKATDTRARRRELERDPVAVPLDLAWRHLGDDDPSLRHAARAALEARPSATWIDRWRAETAPRAVATGMLALARSGSDRERQAVLEQLANGRFDPADPESALIALRAGQVALARGKADPSPPATLRANRLREAIAARFPTPFHPVNRLAGELLAHLKEPGLVTKVMPLLQSAPNQEEALFWLMLLRNVRVGWTPESRANYVKALEAADRYVGGRELPIALFSIAAEFRDGLTPAERSALPAGAGTSAEESAPLKPARLKQREWRVDDLLVAGSRRPDLKRGREVFREALCSRCHRFDDQGKPIGPDLDAVVHRMGRKDLLEAILVPSKSIDGKYASQVVTLTDGRTVTGRLVGGDDRDLLLAPDAASPFQTVRIRVAEIERRSASAVSPMPMQLLDGFTADEIHDLLAYLESR